MSEALREYAPSTTAGLTWSLSVHKTFNKQNVFTASEGVLKEIDGKMQSFTTSIGGADSSRYIKEVLPANKNLTAKYKAEVMATYKAKMKALGFLAIP